MSVGRCMDLPKVLRSVMAGTGACERWSTKEIAVSRTERWCSERSPLVDNSLLIRCRASCADCCVVSTPGVDAGTGPSTELAVRCRFNGRSGVVLSRVAVGTSPLLSSGTIPGGVRCVVSTEFSRLESLWTSACILSSLVLVNHVWKWVVRGYQAAPTFGL